MIDKCHLKVKCKECGQELEAWFDHPYDNIIIVEPCNNCIQAYDPDDYSEIESLANSIIDIVKDIKRKEKGELE